MVPYTPTNQRISMQLAALATLAEISTPAESEGRKSRRTGRAHPGLCFVHGDLVEAPRVASALEIGLQPDLDHAVDEPVTQQVGRKTKNVGVVVQPAHLRGQIVVAGGGTNARKLVRHDTHAHSCAADQNSPINLPRADGGRNLGRVVGVIDALGTLRAEVEPLVAQFGKPGEHLPLHGKASMIAGNGNFHGLSNTFSRRQMRQGLRWASNPESDAGFSRSPSDRRRIPPAALRSDPKYRRCLATVTRRATRAADTTPGARPCDCVSL